MAKQRNYSTEFKRQVVLDKYELTTKPPKIGHMGAKDVPTERTRKKFLAGVEKQKTQAKAWRPGATDLRGWVTRDDARGLAWVTVKYGPLPVPIKGKAQSTRYNTGEIPQQPGAKRYRTGGEIRAHG